MAITSFSTLKSAVADWLDRDDMGDAIETMIGLCEARFYRDPEIRLRAMEAAFSDTIASGVVAVPSGYLNWKYLYVDGTPVQVLEIRNPDWIYATYPTRSSSAKPQYIAREGDNFIFGPYPDSGYPIKGIYYQKLTALSTSNETNWFTDNAPDFLLYGTLVHSAPYIKDDPRIQVWEMAYQMARAEVVDQEKQEEYPRNMPLAQAVS